jgi:hypothetical protein
MFSFLLSLVRRSVSELSGALCGFRGRRYSLKHKDAIYFYQFFNLYGYILSNNKDINEDHTFVSS